MTPKSTGLRQPLLLGAVLVGLEMLVALAFWSSTPPGNRWLGSTMVFPSDAAVYLSYLEQGAQGDVRLRNLYAVEPHARRIDPYWSALGLVARSGVPVPWLFEISRWAMTLLLAFAVVATARRTLRDRSGAAFVSWIMVFGAGWGWLYTFGIYAFGQWRIDTPTAADVTSEFSLFPALFCGSHMILSLALLLTALRTGWDAFAHGGRRAPALAAAATAILVSFHPYFLAMLGVFWLVSAIANRSRGWRRLVPVSAALIAACLPACSIYLPLYFDQTFKTHHLVTNYLPLAPALSWAMTLAPFALALAWRKRRRMPLEPSEYWLIAWIAAAAICLVLPLPWKRKFTEGLGLALVLLAAPAWLHLKSWLARNQPEFLRPLMASVLVLGLGLGSFQLLASQIAWTEKADGATWFYRPSSLFAAWAEIKASAGAEAVILTDDLVANTYTPAYTGRTVLVGHDHEAPDFAGKIKAWRDFVDGGEAPAALRYLQENAVSHLIMTKPSTRARLAETLEAASWQETFSADGISLWTAPGI